MDVTKLTDKELLELLMEKNEWTQQQLAEELAFDRTNISKVINGWQGLGRPARKLAEMLFHQTVKEP